MGSARYGWLHTQDQSTERLSRFTPAPTSSEQFYQLRAVRDLDLISYK